MIRLLYNLGIRLYLTAIRLAGLNSPKARAWVLGRRGWKAKLKNWASEKAGGAPVAWVHCSSLGEYEQVRSLLREIQVAYPGWRICLTFFSPSGYQNATLERPQDGVFYLPSDIPAHVDVFLETVHPQISIFVRYDFWLNYMFGLRDRQIPAFLIGAKWSGNEWYFNRFLRFSLLPAFSCFRAVFCQDEHSARVASRYLPEASALVTGDSRFDSVVAASEIDFKDERLLHFCRDYPVVICGSMHEAEEEMALELSRAEGLSKLKWILAPHEIDSGRISRIISKESGRMIAWSDLDKLQPHHDILWIDNIGKLKYIYRYGTVAFVGGGFSSGVHNLQEPAVYGLPVCFGPRHEKFQEATDLIRLGAATVIADTADLRDFIRKYVSDPEKLSRDSKAAAAYIRSRSGATKKILNYLEPWLSGTSTTGSNQLSARK